MNHITRRTLLAALAALPFVGKAVETEASAIPPQSGNYTQYPVVNGMIVNPTHPRPMPGPYAEVVGYSVLGSEVKDHNFNTIFPVLQQLVSEWLPCTRWVEGTAFVRVYYV